MVGTEAMEQQARKRHGAGAFARACRRVTGGMVRRLPMAGGFFLLSLAQCLSVPSPYALCCLMALIGAGSRPWAAFAGLGLGFGARVLWGVDWDAGQFLACALCLPMMLLKWEKPRQVTAAAGVLLLFRALPGLISAGSSQTAILSLAGAGLGIAAMPALNRAARIVKDRAWQVNRDDLICLALPCLLLIAGAGRLAAFGANIGYAASALAVLLLSWSWGGAAGVCAGLGCGMALLLGGAGTQMLIRLAFGALMAGLFQGRRRPAAAGAFLLACAVLSYVISWALVPSLFFAEAAGCAVFCLTPGRFIRRAERFVRRLRWSQPRENAYTRLKMQRWVRAIDRMADALPHPVTDEMPTEEKCEALMEKLCQDCDRLPICWHEQYDSTRAGMLALAEPREDRDPLDVVSQYFSACHRITKIPDLLRRMEEADQRRRKRAVCAEYERDMLQTHLTALSQAAQCISLEGMSGDAEEAWGMEQAEEALQDMRFPGKTVFLKRVDGRLTVGVQYDPLALRPEAGREMENLMSLRLKTPLAITEKQGDRVLLEEIPPLTVLSGVATACAATRERKTKLGSRPDNGDAVLTRKLTGGRALLALSDGMGHGAGAQDESRKTLELLSLCMEAGYSRSQAMTAVNGAMLSMTGGEKFATVDLCVIDLWTGQADMNKLGACESYVIQGQKIRSVQGAALPLGIIEHVRPMEHHIRLSEGDLVVLLSDGVADAFDKEDGILAVLEKYCLDGPQQIADQLLQEAMIQQDGMPRDDMTVLCARIAERKRDG